ncbi:hypothetical protein EK0264_14090 [Epidermidibacterium keratini]|uniref:Uncharacterized protein n=1 Tax=Epidermidibacterium keratini TaxID=1891644 RepID=A0A7L4YQ97_9ACTN|nr:hypothetical protein [Epidermidibacterium keratini]QHC01300.1 hypothetical protein EK0264_14090 [Epidermidibacterium keratini]
MLSVLAAVQQPNNPDWGKAGPVALFVLLAFIATCYFLFRSMGRQMRKVPASFDGPATPKQQQRLGTAKAVIPPRQGDDSYEAYAARGGATPKLGTPNDLLSDSGKSSTSSAGASGGSDRAARREQIRQAKARRRAK